MILRQFFSFIILIFFTGVCASELRFGKGDMKINSKIFGYSSTLKEDITAFSLSEIHKNIFKTNVFYAYDITFINSKKESKYIDLYNNSVETAPLPSSYKPLMDYKLQGLDAQIDLGYDILNKDKQKTFLGFALSLGISLPYIKNFNSDNNSSDTKNYLPDSKTKITTYRVGITTKFGYPILKRISLFSFFTYAYQTGNVKNKALGINSSSDGYYLTAGIGFKFYLFEYERKIWKITFSPRLYITTGYKYDLWLLKDIKINNTSILVRKDDLKITNQIGFVGIGYSF